MNRLSILLVTMLSSVIMLCGLGSQHAKGRVSPTANAAYDLHMFIFYITVVIGVIVFGVMFHLNIPS